jgi:hypothetical protein
VGVRLTWVYSVLDWVMGGSVGPGQGQRGSWCHGVVVLVCSVRARRRVRGQVRRDAADDV